MIDNEMDHGERCPRHTGEVFLPRCADCDAAAGGDQ
jgi:hypothetical protein